MSAELHKRVIAIKADKQLCAMCGMKKPDPGKMRAHAFRFHRHAISANLLESGGILGAEAPSWCIHCEECTIFTGSALEQDVHSQTERNQLQREINRPIGIPAMNDQPRVNQQQLTHVSKLFKCGPVPVRFQNPDRLHIFILHKEVIKVQDTIPFSH